MRERLRKLSAAAGIAALVGGILALQGPGRGATGLTVLFYIAGGGLGMAMTYLLYRDWLTAHPIDAPDVEGAIEHPRPGDAFDRTLSQFDGTGRGYLPDRNSLHDRLRELAAGILSRRRDHTYQEARAVVEAGEWPDDPDVAAFLGNPDTELDRSVVGDLPILGGGRKGSDFQVLVGRTVDALATRSGVVDIGPDDGASTIVRDPEDPGRGARRADDLVPAGPGRTVPTERWLAAVPVALAFVGFGFLVQNAPVVLAATIALGFVVYARAFEPAPAPAVERSIDADRATPGDTIEVTVTIHNDGDRIIPDLRVIDGVPEGLAVTDGSPRYATALRPGESTSFTYAVTARRGVHAFDPAYTIVRDHAGATGRVRLVATSGDSTTSVTCVPSLGTLPVPVPLYAQSREYLGRLPAGGGEGTEFHSIREYRAGDSMARIDWKHLAGSPDEELTTVRFREERAATVVLVVDTYPTAYLASAPGEPSAVERSIEAAGRLFGSLLDSGDRVGIAALGPRLTWLDPGVGMDHRTRVEELLATDPAFPPVPPGDDEYHPRWVREFHRRFPRESQVVLLSPLCDPRYRFLTRQLQGFGHPITVVSPDPTVDGTVGQRLVRLERRLRIETLRESGVRVIDWDPGEELAVALSRAGARWSG